MKERIINMMCLAGIVLLYMAVIAGCLLTMTGCTTVKEVVKNDTIIHTEYVSRIDSVYLKDSVYLHDSVFVEVKGDTTLIERWHTKYVDKWRDRLLRDTCFVRDTVKVKEIVKEPAKTKKENKTWKATKGVLSVVGLFTIISAIAGTILVRRKI